MAIMGGMTPRLNSELSATLKQQQGGPLEVQDELGQTSYVIVSKQDYQLLLERKFQEWLQVGLDSLDSGPCVEWNLEEFLAEAHRRFEARQGDHAQG
ncbi:MAG: hypothetical protein JSS27_12005 [Planctomycetes bacterium]|nr:hypothetical protein [Planctomycetota bacterium]